VAYILSLNVYKHFEKELCTESYTLHKNSSPIALHNKIALKLLHTGILLQSFVFLLGQPLVVKGNAASSGTPGDPERVLISSIELRIMTSNDSIDSFSESDDETGEASAVSRTSTASLVDPQDESVDSDTATAVRAGRNDIHAGSVGATDNAQDTTTPASGTKSSMKALEVDVGLPSDDAQVETRKDDKEDDGIPTIMQSLSIDQDEECLDDDLEQLLTDGKPTNKQQTSNQRGSKTNERCGCCPQPERVGNMQIFFPSSFHRMGWGIAGPHWFGPPCILVLLLLASAQFVSASLRFVGYGTTAICILLSCAVFYNLINTAYRDPGVVRNSPTEEEAEAQQYRWCDLCNNYQPPDGAHCPDCNVCIAGFDHHCVWMGSCIGKNNVQYFVRFNLSWLGYLLYSIVWVSILGPILFHKQNSELK